MYFSTLRYCIPPSPGPDDSIPCEAGCNRDPRLGLVSATGEASDMRGSPQGTCGTEAERIRFFCLAHVDHARFFIGDYLLDEIPDSAVSATAETQPLHSCHPGDAIDS